MGIKCKIKSNKNNNNKNIKLMNDGSACQVRLKKCKTQKRYTDTCTAYVGVNTRKYTRRKKEREKKEKKKKDS